MIHINAIYDIQNNIYVDGIVEFDKKFDVKLTFH